MNIIEVMRLLIGTKLKSSINKKIINVCEQDGVKVLKFEDDFRRLFLDNDITEASYEIV